MTILELQHVGHTFPDGTVALRDVNLAIHEGDFAIIAGANGSGKTVLVRHFNGLLLPTEGKVLVNGAPIKKDLTSARRQIGLIFQDPDSQIVGQTVAEDVAFGPENLRLPLLEVKQRVDEALEIVGLSHLARQRPHVLSGGQKRRLAIAGVLAMKPRVIVLDEPFSALDYHGVVQVLRQIVDLHREGHTIVVIIHELEQVLAHANRLIIMDAGRIVEDGSPSDLIDRVERYGIRLPYGRERRLETMTWLT
jgi:biotin transport system ATP-binding protein